MQQIPETVTAMPDAVVGIWRWVVIPGVIVWSIGRWWLWGPQRDGKWRDAPWRPESHVRDATALGMGIGLLCYVLVTLFAKQPAISASQLELNNPGIAVIAGLLGLAGGLLPRLIWRCSKLKEKLNPHRKWELHAVTAVASFLGSFSLLAYLSWDGWHQAILSAYCGLFAGFAVSSIIARCLDLAKTS